MFDEDIKIASPGAVIKTKESAGNKPSSFKEEYDRESSSGNTEKAKQFGISMADDLLENLQNFAMEGEDSKTSDMALQRGILMAFAANTVIEEHLKSSVVCMAAKNSFNNELESLAPTLYKGIGDSGAFSFYYLAYRRGNEVDRRIGQTFAMLCAHDGDPIYQELGEAIYCWFISRVSKKLKEIGLE